MSKKVAIIVLVTVIVLLLVALAWLWKRKKSNGTSSGGGGGGGGLPEFDYTGDEESQGGSQGGSLGEPDIGEGNIFDALPGLDQDALQAETGVSSSSPWKSINQPLILEKKSQPSAGSIVGRPSKEALKVV